ncbi:hypothetical protein BV898_00016 [Hypsibius exemplaris]|jgi:hypothetical protein|uniref:Uncharacterized protein n=1 Tax=Hypsibius exemplaris TaxID=2072580 RepID=A0A1W0XEH6_HYPEX|nr:hypothetical protein BV898_00016 [Hypsibius exemplaris]
MRRLVITLFLLNLVSIGLTAVDLSQRSYDEGDALLVRKSRQINPAGFNSGVNFLNAFLTGFVITPSTNTVISNSSTFTITPQFWTTFFMIVQYATFAAWFVLLVGAYVFGVAVLFLFSIIAPASTNTISNNVFSNGLFRSFEDENMPLFDKVTSVGYGFLDRTSELYNLVQSPACSRYMMCHLSSTLGDQEANGFLFKDLLRSISSTLDNKGGTEGMSRSVNVGLLTGECDEPLMNCPELAPYFKKVADTWSNYI